MYSLWIRRSFSSTVQSVRSSPSLIEYELKNSMSPPKKTTFPLPSHQKNQKDEGPSRNHRPGHPPINGHLHPLSPYPFHDHPPVRARQLRAARGTEERHPHAIRDLRWFPHGEILPRRPNRSARPVPLLPVGHLHRSRMPNRFQTQLLTQGEENRVFWYLASEWLVRWWQRSKLERLLYLRCLIFRGADPAGWMDIWVGIFRAEGRLAGLSFFFVFFCRWGQGGGFFNPLSSRLYQVCIVVEERWGLLCGMEGITGWGRRVLGKYFCQIEGPGANEKASWPAIHTRTHTHQHQRKFNPHRRCSLFLFKKK